MDGRSTGKKRNRKFFTTKADAENFVWSYHSDVHAFGEDFASYIHRINTADRARILLSLQRLDRMGWTLEDAVEFIEKNGKNPRSISLDELNRLFIADKNTKGCRNRYLDNLQKSLKRFTANRGEIATNEVTPVMVRDFINGNGWKPATRKSYLIDLRAFFSFGVRQKLIKENPAEAIDFPILEDKPPGIVSVEACRKVLDSCQRTDPKFVPFVALLFFSGMRSSEARKISMNEIGNEFVEVTAHKAKTRRRRLIKITPQLRAWLDAGFAAGGTVPPANWQRRWKNVRAKVGEFENWPQNAARHSFVSYHYAKFRSAAETAAIAGHSEQMLFAHYRELVKPDDADAFFGLLPDPSAIAEGVEFDKLPKHVPPHV